jgi:hypothetical protein
VLHLLWVETTTRALKALTLLSLIVRRQDILNYVRCATPLGTRGGGSLRVSWALPFFKNFCLALHMGCDIHVISRFDFFYVFDQIKLAFLVTIVGYFACNFFLPFSSSLSLMVRIHRRTVHVCSNASSGKSVMAHTSIFSASGLEAPSVAWRLLCVFYVVACFSASDWSAFHCRSIN